MIFLDSTQNYQRNYLLSDFTRFISISSLIFLSFFCFQTGTGLLDGSDGKIYTDTQGLTTATSIVKLTTVSFPKE
jgi:hypothetical protein